MPDNANASSRSTRPAAGSASAESPSAKEEWPLLEGYLAGRAGATHTRNRGVDFDEGWRLGRDRAEAGQGGDGRLAARRAAARRKRKVIRTERWLRTSLADEVLPRKTRGTGRTPGGRLSDSGVDGRNQRGD